jgi:hypothetical protein
MYTVLTNLLINHGLHIAWHSPYRAVLESRMLEVCTTLPETAG